MKTTGTDVISHQPAVTVTSNTHLFHTLHCIRYYHTLLQILRGSA